MDTRPLCEGLAAEVRRLNQLAADGADMVNGPGAVHDRTAGEARDVHGLSKQLGMPGAASIVDVRATANEVARVLGIVVDEHERRARKAPHNDGRILEPDYAGRVDPFLKSSRVMNLDQLSAYADRENAKAAQLRRQSDLDGALGVSKSSRETAQQVAKSRGQRLPSDSYTGSHEPLAAKLMRRP